MAHAIGAALAIASEYLALPSLPRSALSTLSKSSSLRSGKPYARYEPATPKSARSSRRGADERTRARAPRRRPIGFVLEAHESLFASRARRPE